MKSHMTKDTILELMERILADGFRLCSMRPCKRDLKTIRSRVDSQGLSFLTIALPRFCQDVEQCLELGRVDSTHFQNFRKRGVGPAFLQDLLSQIINYKNGELHDKPPNPRHTIAEYLAVVRQICLAFKKILIPCTDSRSYAAVERFVTTERELSDHHFSDSDERAFSAACRVLWGPGIHRLEVGSASPKHGPGATADRVYGNRKFDWRRWHDRLEHYFPLIGNCYPDTVAPYHEEVLKNVEIVKEDDEQPVRVVFVPKDLKSPRVIAIEPSCMQFVQQGIKELLYDFLESYWLTRGHINFSNQQINQQLAISSSADGRLATIDLKDASDRVPLSLIHHMFESNPTIYGAILACRSMKAELPDGRVIPLAKFASMGSALCFPIEAMYFYTICVMALMEFHNYPLSSRNAELASRDVYVYGDDILVPVESIETVLAYLDKYKCKVNANKTFYRGKFRESCGVDAYSGSLVKPTYVRRLPPESRRQASSVISWVETANLFYKSGYLLSSDYMFHRVERITGSLPCSPDDSQVLGRSYFWSAVKLRKRFNKRYQRLEVRCWVPGPVRRKDRLRDYAALAKCLLKLDRLKDLSAERDQLHLVRTEIHGESAIYRRWVPITKIGLSTQ